MKVLVTFINSNVFISLSAVALTVATQIQLGMNPEWHPYLFIIFFATLFEYNLHRLLVVLSKKHVLSTEQHQWAYKNRTLFYVLVVSSVIGLSAAVVLARLEVLLALAPIALLTLLYSLPIATSSGLSYRFRQVPYLKIFLISLAWSSVTVILPVVQSDHEFRSSTVMLILIERFLFVFAITIPFDVRDMVADNLAGLKTIPLLLGEAASTKLSVAMLVALLVVSVVHYIGTQQWMILLAMTISVATTLLFITNNRIRSLPHYHYGILDGSMMLQGLLIALSRLLIH